MFSSCPAMALFHSKEDGRLMPIAIQLFQKPSDDNPVSEYFIVFKTD